MSQSQSPVQSPVQSQVQSQNQRLDQGRGKVLWHVTMTLDGFIAGPDNSMDWGAGISLAPGVFEEVMAGTGAILSGRRGYDMGIDAGIDPAAAAYGGAWTGPLFVLTHHPEDAKPNPAITFLDCDIGDAVETALAAAGGKNLEVFGSDLARQCVVRGLIDEFYVHLAPVMLGAGIRLFDHPGGNPIRWDRIHDGDPAQALDLRFRPTGR